MGNRAIRTLSTTTPSIRRDSQFFQMISLSPGRVEGVALPKVPNIVANAAVYVGKKKRMKQRKWIVTIARTKIVNFSAMKDNSNDKRKIKPRLLPEFMFCKSTSCSLVFSIFRFSLSISCLAL